MSDVKQAMKHLVPYSGNRVIFNQRHYLFGELNAVPWLDAMGLAIPLLPHKEKI